MVHYFKWGHSRLSIRQTLTSSPSLHLSQLMGKKHVRYFFHQMILSTLVQKRNKWDIVVFLIRGPSIVDYLMLHCLNDDHLASSSYLNGIILFLLLLQNMDCYSLWQYCFSSSNILTPQAHMHVLLMGVSMPIPFATNGR